MTFVNESFLLLLYLDFIILCFYRLIQTMLPTIAACCWLLYAILFLICLIIF